jgi:glycosyltransferase involved in cell wall biosynthesis
MIVVHLTASRFFGGPERQMLDLARSLPAPYQTMFVSFSETGLCRALLQRVHGAGFAGVSLQHDTPHLWAADRELIGLLREARADVLCCHGYKANLLGWLASRRLRIPAISVSRGWTFESLRVRVYEAIDRRVLRWMDRVVCVSRGQAEKVLECGVAPEKCHIIPNAIRLDRFVDPKPVFRDHLASLFAARPSRIVGAAGRLSPEKGFEVLVDAASEVIRKEPGVGFVIFGDGTLRDSLAERIRQRGLEGRFVLAGFRADLDHYLPHLDALALSSFTEGLPNVILEAFACGVPVVATAVGGVPEVVEHGVNGYCVAPGEPAALAAGIMDLLSNDVQRRTMGENGRKCVAQEFTFEAQARQYVELFEELRLTATGYPRAGVGARKLATSLAQPALPHPEAGTRSRLTEGLAHATEPVCDSNEIVT